MATDQVSICNLAFGFLGDLGKVKRLTAFTRAGCGTNPVHHAALDFYDMAKEQMHAMMDWPRTRKIKALTIHDDDPVLSGLWTYKYVRPPDAFLIRKIIDESGTEYEWDEVNEERIENGQTFNDEYIYCNSTDMYAWYSILIGEERYMPGMAQLHALILADSIAMTATGKEGTGMAISAKLHQRMETLCMGLGAKEGYVANEKGENAMTDLF